MGARRLNPNRARIHRSYTVGEAAQLYGVHRNTVRAWLKQGLQGFGEAKPMLILGAELRRFLKARRAANRHPCGIGEVYCFRCRFPRRPAGSMADFTPSGATAGNLSALCGDCGGLMNRRIRFERIREQFPGIDVHVRQAEPRLSRTKTLSPDCAIPAGVEA